ncbi:hypothetical protein ACKUB1_17990 [Methanospirillum stamsii]|uniref:hypothetical protein n=1 Tax=Methanospirillum stamsii TaxID=1277351 RepID=UPI0015E87622|nr:hypothetical protein [Methanospirillum stamsii]
MICRRRRMIVELKVSGISFGVSLANTTVVALMYVRCINQARGMFHMLRVDKNSC